MKVRKSTDWSDNALKSLKLFGKRKAPPGGDREILSLASLLRER
jgi:hypothetical protein